MSCSNSRQYIIDYLSCRFTDGFYFIQLLVLRIIQSCTTALLLAICKGNSLPMPLLSGYYVLMFFKVQELAFTLFHVYSKTIHSISILTPVYCEFRLNPCIELESDLFDCSHGLQFDNSTSTKTLKPKRHLWRRLWGCFHHHVVLPVPLYIDSSISILPLAVVHLNVTSQYPVCLWVQRFILTNFTHCPTMTIPRHVATPTCHR